MMRRIAPLGLLVLLAGVMLGLWQGAQGAVRLISAPPQLTVGEVATLHFASGRAGKAQALSSNIAVAGMEVLRTEDGLIVCTVTAHADGTALLSCMVGNRQSPVYAVSIVPPVAVPLTSGEFIASKNGGKFHKIDCPWADRILKENRVYFARAADARAESLLPCAHCLKTE